MIMNFKNISDDDGVILVKMARKAVGEYINNGNVTLNCIPVDKLISNNIN